MQIDSAYDIQEACDDERDGFLLAGVLAYRGAVPTLLMAIENHAEDDTVMRAVIRALKALTRSGALREPPACAARPPPPTCTVPRPPSLTPRHCWVRTRCRGRAGEVVDQMREAGVERAVRHVLSRHPSDPYLREDAAPVCVARTADQASRGR